MLSGKVALVTGGAGAVGREIVAALAERGARVILNCFHSYDVGKLIAQQMRQRGLDVRVIRASVAQQPQVTAMFNQIQNDYGRLDILVNNAAIGILGHLDDVTDKGFTRILDTNLKGPLWCIKAARPLMAAAGGGSIVNVSAIGSMYVTDGYLMMGAAKAGLENLTKYLAVELAPLGIRVNVASCGPIESPTLDYFPDPVQLRVQSAAATPMGRLASARDFANVVVMLSGPDSGWITGQTVLADGGLTSVLFRPGPPAPATQPTPAGPPSPAGPPAPADPPAPAGPEPDAAAPRGGAEPLPPVTGADDPIAVVGMGLAVPGASSPAEFWTLLNDGGELFVEPPADRWRADDIASPDPAAPDKSYQPRAGFITSFTPHPRLAAEDAAEQEAAYPGPWLRHSLYQAMESVTCAAGDQVELCVGFSADMVPHLEESVVLDSLLHELEAPAATGPASPDAERIAAALTSGLRSGAAGKRACLPRQVVTDAMGGILPGSTRVRLVDTACSSALYAIDLGVRALRSGTADIAVCGGAEALTAPSTVLFSKLSGLSTAGAVRALDRGADGALFCDAAAVVVLKRLSRALADGDRVLGLIAGIGLSSDGKGKAIYAPSSKGQALAIRRAFSQSGVTPGDVGFIVAHATGTPAGDSAEITALRDCYATGQRVWVTSNKSLIGHSGWAAGAVSMIHLLLAMAERTVPAQYRLSKPARAFTGQQESDLAVPAQPEPWPAQPGRPRVGAISGFGFGGTNAHLLVSEYVPGAARGPASVTRPAEPLTIVGWSGHWPGADDSSAVASLARHGVSGPDRRLSFGDSYPVPPLKQLRVPPATARMMDRTQLMMLECVRRLDPAVLRFCRDNADRAGVVVGHTGMTRSGVLYSLRCRSDHVRRILGENGLDTAAAPFLSQVQAWLDRVQPPPTEDSSPGVMANVIAARVVNYYDLHGPAVAVDDGHDSLAAALEVAACYLQSGDLDIALVGTASGNSLPAWACQVTSGLSAAPATLAEGAFLFALTRQATAAEHGLPLLAAIDPAAEGRREPQGEDAA